MMTSARLRLIAVLAASTLVLGAGVAFASDNEDPILDPICVTEPDPIDASTTDPTTTDPTTSDPSDEEVGEETTTDPSEGPVLTCEEPTEDEGSEPGDSGSATEADPTDATEGETPAPDRTTECNGAAGIVTDPTLEPATEEPVKTTGLDHAIERVLANCIKNPQAPGLVNALEHLVANRDLHADRDAAKAEARAARDAAKTERAAAHDAAKAARDAAKAAKAATHGPSGSHGNSGH